MRLNKKQNTKLVVVALGQMADSLVTILTWGMLNPRWHTILLYADWLWGEDEEDFCLHPEDSLHVSHREVWQPLMRKSIKKETAKIDRRLAYEWVKKAVTTDRSNPEIAEVPPEVALRRLNLAVGISEDHNQYNDLSLHDALKNTVYWEDIVGPVKGYGKYTQEDEES
tara:strand:- start:710 stop:1213 length:504 start_codon:yes stop_codon:yes gene_type:complete